MHNMFKANTSVHMFSVFSSIFLLVPKLEHFVLPKKVIFFKVVAAKLSPKVCVIPVFSFYQSILKKKGEKRKNYYYFFNS